MERKLSVDELMEIMSYLPLFNVVHDFGLVNKQFHELSQRGTPYNVLTSEIKWRMYGNDNNEIVNPHLYKLFSEASDVKLDFSHPNNVAVECDSLKRWKPYITKLRIDLLIDIEDEDKIWKDLIDISPQLTSLTVNIYKCQCTDLAVEMFRKLNWNILESLSFYQFSLLPSVSSILQPSQSLKQLTIVHYYQDVLKRIANFYPNVKHLTINSKALLDIDLQSEYRNLKYISVVAIMDKITADHIMAIKHVPKITLSINDANLLPLIDTHLANRLNILMCSLDRIPSISSTSLEKLYVHAALGASLSSTGLQELALKCPNIRDLQIDTLYGGFNFVQWKHLTTLTLTCVNQLIIPSGIFCTMQNLALLQISHCQKFSELPDDLALAPSLTHVRLSGNSFSTIPEVLQRCNLKELDLSHNPIASIDGCSFMVAPYKKFSLANTPVVRSARDRFDKCNEETLGLTIQKSQLSQIVSEYFNYRNASKPKPIGILPGGYPIVLFNSGQGYFQMCFVSMDWQSGKILFSTTPCVVYGYNE